MRVPAVGVLACSFLALSLAMPRGVDAGPITATVEFAFPFSYPDLEFGDGLGFARIKTGGFEGSSSDQLIGPKGAFHIVAGDIRLVSGSLIDVTLSGGDAAYTHAAGGSLSIDFDLELPDGSLHHGTFAAPLGEFIVDGAEGGTSGDLGPGLFDPVTAGLLGIQPHTLLSVGAASLYLDIYDAYPQPHREAQAFGYVVIAASVPEPGTGLLVALGVGAAIKRRRHGEKPKAYLN